MRENREYILPARFDDTEIEGLHDTIHYIDLRTTTPTELASLTVEKLGNPVRSEYLPPVLDRLFDRLDIEGDDDAQESVESAARSFYEVVRRMKPDERSVVLSLIRNGCPADLPDNIHMNVDLLRRYTGKSIDGMKRILGGLRSLGFECGIRESTTEESRVQGTVLGESYFFELDWIDLSGSGDCPALLVAHAMVAVATEYYCDKHGTEYLDRLDFSQLSSATVSQESGAEHAANGTRVESSNGVNVNGH